jgi:hypothetical protein
MVNGCDGPVLLEGIQNQPEVKKPEKPLKEWREGAPPQGKYMLDTGEDVYEVDVGHNIFTWNGETHHISRAYKLGVLRGPKPKSKEEHSMTKSTLMPAQNQDVSPKLPDIPGLTAEADAEIRRALHELAKIQARVPKPSIAPQLVAAYGVDMRAVREKKHGWQKIAKVFRAHGLRVGEKSLKARIEP